jgi:hypothetical protein
MHTCSCTESCTLNAHTFDAHVSLCDSPQMHAGASQVHSDCAQHDFTAMAHERGVSLALALLCYWRRVASPERTHSLTHSLKFFVSHLRLSLDRSHSATSRTTQPHHVTSRYVTSRHVTSRHVTLRHVTSRHVTSRHVTSRHVTSRHVTSRHVTSRHIHITSPRLNTQDFVSDVDRSIWWHYIAVITPNTVAVADRAMMYVVHFGQAHMHLIFSARQTTFMATLNIHTHTHTPSRTHTHIHTHTHTHTHPHTHTHTHSRAHTHTHTHTNTHSHRRYMTGGDNNNGSLPHDATDEEIALIGLVAVQAQTMACILCVGSLQPPCACHHSVTQPQ